MKLSIQESHQPMEPHLILQCEELTPELKQIAQELHTLLIHCSPSGKIQGRKNDSISLLSPSEIYYFESVDNLIFAYTSHEDYQVNMTLTAAAEDLCSLGFIRISKTQVLNVNHLASLKSLMNGNVEGILDNKEHIIISSRYARALRIFLKGEQE